MNDPAPAPPPAILVIHPREKRRKCSVEPLRGRPGFVFWTFPVRGPEPLDGYVRLGLGGPMLSESDAGAGLLILDGTWHLAGRMEGDFAALPVRSLPPVKTAYPRASKLFDDPGEGLATIEALYVAHRLLGRETDGLLDGYRWKDEFLRNWQACSEAVN
jgi:pre-rRNA-processing protein TSR3